MKRVVVLMLVSFLMVETTIGVRFSKCELVKQLRKQGFSEYLMNDLVCLIGESSGFRTHVISGPGSDGSFSFGLFQISDRFWCNTGPYPGKACNVRCVDLLLDDITIAASCAKTIIRSGGLYAMTAWEKYCRGYNLPPHNCGDIYTDNL